MITIVDYGLGNIKAFANIYKQLDIPFKIAQNIDELKGATKIILPGVGAFDHAMQQLERSGMRPLLDELIVDAKIPVVGICVGMQMLARSSDEGKLPGLNWIDASVKKFDETKIDFATHLPHMGWNDVKAVGTDSIFKGLEQDAKFYFLHSYYFACEHQENVIATANYGIEFCCAVNKDNVYGVQFHPEKSHQFGITLLQNFANL